jgi:hypothetical protein
MKRNAAFVIIIVVTIVATVFILLRLRGGSDGTPDVTDKIKIHGFNSQSACEALTPGCGYCPGEESGSDCYVTQAEFDAYKKQYPELQADN